MMQILEITAFDKVNEVTSPEKLMPNELAILENMRLDEQAGVATTRKGFARYLTSPVIVAITNAVAGSGIVVVTANNHRLINSEFVVITGVLGMTDLDGTFTITYIDINNFSVILSTAQTYAGGGSITSVPTPIINNLFDIQDANNNNYLFANAGTKLKKYYSGIWSNVKTGLTSSKIRMAAYGKNFFFTNGYEKPFYTDLIGVNDVGIDKQNVANITATAVEVDSPPYNVSPGVRYIIVGVANDGQKSNASNQFVILDGGKAFASVTLNNLPIFNDERIVTKQIYRTRQNINTIFYLLAEIDNLTTTYTDNTTDDNLNSAETIEYLNSPKSKYIISNGERLWMANLSKQMINRVIPPIFIYDYAIHGGSGVDSIFIQESAGNMGVGIYKYAYSFVDNLGNESELVPYFEHGITTPNSGINFYMVGYPVASLEPNSALLTMISGIKSIRLYRTKANGNIYYWRYDIKVPTEPVFSLPSESDDANDSLLTIQFPKEVVHNSDEILNLPSAVIYSNLFKPIEFPELNYIEVYPDDSDKITGIFDDDNGVIVFKENSICKIFTTGDSENWQVQKLVTNIGCDQPNSIYKHGNLYFFVFRNKVYMSMGGGEPQEISYKRKTTFDSITEFLGSTFHYSVLWYVLTVKIDNSYYLMCYDTKLETWYKFSISQADTILEKKFGADKGKLLLGGNKYITYYNESQDYDNDTGTKTDITIYLKTKDYSFPDNFVVARLMFLFVNYYRLTNTIAQQIDFMITDPVTGLTKKLEDFDETTLQNIYKIATDGMIGALQRCFKLNFSINGVALSKFYATRIEYNIEPWRLLKKSTVHETTDDTGKVLTDDTDKPMTDDGGAFGIY